MNRKENAQSDELFFMVKGVSKFRAAPEITLISATPSLVAFSQEANPLEALRRADD
jgi:hypothetical protein